MYSFTGVPINLVKAAVKWEYYKYLFGERGADKKAILTNLFILRKKLNKSEKRFILRESTHKPTPYNQPTYDLSTAK